MEGAETQLKETNLIRVRGQEYLPQEQNGYDVVFCMPGAYKYTHVACPISLNPYNNVIQVPNSPHVTIDTEMN